MARSVTLAAKPSVRADHIETDEVVGAEWIMYHCKILPCRKRYSHDWSDCVFAHAGEKIQRRCPRKHGYHGIMCPDIKKFGVCPRGETCCYTHNSFEYWLHPSRYRTELCTFGTACSRPVCFFAHTASELRTPGPCLSPTPMSSENLDRFLGLDILDGLQTPSPTFCPDMNSQAEDQAWAFADMSMACTQAMSAVSAPAAFPPHATTASKLAAYQRPYAPQHLYQPSPDEYALQDSAAYTPSPSLVQGLPLPSTTSTASCAPSLNPRQFLDKPEPQWSQAYPTSHPSPSLRPSFPTSCQRPPMLQQQPYRLSQGVYPSSQPPSRMWATDSPYISTAMMSYEPQAIPSYSMPASPYLQYHPR